MQGIRHPLTGDIYDLTDDEHITVTDDGGRVGLFTLDGRYISGDVKVADPHVCGWMAHTPGATSIAPQAT